ncbi:rhodanese-like domain-containing protein [Lachnoclostridium sp. Marseille-P6806]|uniref:rhodanese-like domain-containing protein n=1 Tax=Lachnoclostridium sp. Marseille-P6806 TaxID=2364793 RepID=UPI00102F79AC|nr:rhodanese-like domain-containing protein [Lachnoclostridium sp. Marseille-P6806]
MKALLVSLIAVALLIAAVIFFILVRGSADGAVSIARENAADAAGYRTISQEEAKEILDSDEDYILLDVRTQEEYDEKHIPGAILIPNETIGTVPPEELPDLNQKILVYCRSGNRSRQAAEKLAAMGYTEILDFGGINSWPYDTTTE